MRAVPVTPRHVMFTVWGQCPSLHAEGLIAPKPLDFFGIPLNTFCLEPPVCATRKNERERALSLVQGHNYGFHLRAMDIDDMDDIGPAELFTCVVRAWRRRQKLHSTCELVFTYDPLGQSGRKAGRTGRQHYTDTCGPPGVAYRVHLALPNESF